MNDNAVVKCPLGLHTTWCDAKKRLRAEMPDVTECILTEIVSSIIFDIKTIITLIFVSSVQPYPCL